MPVRSPAWHRNARRDRRKARLALRTTERHSPNRLERARSLFNHHHGSKPPAAASMSKVEVPVWQWSCCGKTFGTNTHYCNTCGYHYSQTRPPWRSQQDKSEAAGARQTVPMAKVSNSSSNTAAAREMRNGKRLQQSPPLAGKSRRSPGNLCKKKLKSCRHRLLSTSARS